MASQANGLDITDWKSVLIFIGCFLAGDVLRGLVEIIGNINFDENYKIYVTFIAAALVKLAQRYLTDYAAKYGVKYSPPATPDLPIDAEINAPRDER